MDTLERSSGTSPSRTGTEQLTAMVGVQQIDRAKDNLSVHKAASIRQALEAHHCQLLFLPPTLA